MPAPTARIPIPLASLRGMRALFEIAHQKRFGFISPGKEIEIEAVEVTAKGGGEPMRRKPELPDERTARRLRRHATTRLFTQGAWHEAPVFFARVFTPGMASRALPSSSRTIRPSWSSPAGRRKRTAQNHLLLARIAKRPEARVGKQADPVMLEVFNNLFVSVAEQMGYALQNTARSVNIKERLDFSCAIFDAKRAADRQRPAYPRASRLDGQERGDGAARDRRGAQARRRATC